MKTHQKTGITLGLKNLVGICTNKNSLPHHTVGTPDAGGDEYPSSSLLLKSLSLGATLFRKVLAASTDKFAPLALRLKKALDREIPDELRRVRSGNWYGNDTIWRTVVDLNRILFWFDPGGRVRSTPRRYLCIVDGIVAGDGEGPLEPEPKPVGVLIAGTNPVAVDSAGARLMGFDPYKIPIITGAIRCHTFPIWDETTVDNVSVVSDGIDGFTGRLEDITHPGLNFTPSFGWRGHIEFRNG
jgi:hypothetical protein